MLSEQLTGRENEKEGESAERKAMKSKLWNTQSEVFSLARLAWQLEKEI